jgi:predicted nuclease of predicted toxin-antitoxin system
MPHGKWNGLIGYPHDLLAGCAPGPGTGPWLGVRFDLSAKPLRDIGLRDADDLDLYQAARRFGQVVIVTKDSDFVGLVRQLGTPPQVLLLSCGNLSTLELQALFSRYLPDALEALKNGQPLVEILGN